MSGLSVDDVISWPDGTWCYADELEDYSYMSDDYTRIPVMTDEWYFFVGRN